VFWQRARADRHAEERGNAASCGCFVNGRLEQLQEFFGESNDFLELQ